MADAGEIKAKVSIEYDGSGIQQAKEDLASLADMAGSFGGEGGIGDAVAAMGDGFAEGTKGAEEFANAIEGVEEPLKSGEEAVSSFNDAIEEHTQAIGDHQAAIEDLGSAYEELPTPVARAQESVVAMNDSFAQSGKSIGETMASYQAFTEQFNNGSTFVPETLWNADDVARMNESVSAVNSSFASIGPTAEDADKAVAEFFGKTNDAANETGGFFDSLFGEGSVFGKIGEGVSGFFGGIGDAIGGLSMGLSEFAMPLFAAQMIGSMASGFGSWLYNTNLAAEGAGASNPASFTSQVNQLGASAQQGTNQFAVGFGAGLNPSINAWNNENNQNGGGSDFWGGVGKFLGGTVGGAGDVLQVLGGSLLAGLSFGNAGMMQTGTNWENSGMQGLVNMYDAANGIPLQYPGTPPYAGATPYQNMMLSNWRAQPGGMTPDQQNVAADWQYFQGMPQGAGSSEPIMSRYTLSGPNAYTQPEGFSGAMQDIGGFFGGIGSGIGNFFGGIGNAFMKFWDPTGDLNNLGATGAAGSFGGCFVAGTPVLMADSTEKPIESLQIGDTVLGYDGSKAIPVTILACLVFPRKQTYTLTFDDGRALTLTDSHPLYSPDTGWRSLSPTMTNEESPDLPVSQLEIGDVIATVDGVCTLLSIEKQGVTQVYNVTVDGTHTYYANGILVHNKVALGGGAQSIGDLSSGFQMPHIDMGAIASNLGSQFSGIQLPHLDLGGIASSLGGSFSGISLPHLDLGGMASSLGGSFSGIQLPHLDLGGMASSLGGAFSGIQLPHLDLGGLSSALGGAFSGITLPPMPNIGSMIQGALGGMFSGFSLPPIPDIGSMINGALSGMFSGFSLPPIPDIGSMINGALGGMFSGFSLPPMPDIGTMINGAISGIFSSVHMPSIPDFGAMINGAISGIFSSIHMPAIPGFAAGIEGFSGGLAMVGEAGPELVMLPGGSSVYPLSSNAPIGGNASPISLGGGGGISGPIHIHNHLSINSRELLSVIGPDIATEIRTSMGLRGY